MFISSFHIDDFGHFNNIDVEGLTPGLSIFFGENESGKSTILEYIRWMFFGFAKKGKKIPGRFFPESDNEIAGAIDLNLTANPDLPSKIKLKRKLKDTEKLLIYSDTLGKFSPDLLEKIFLGVNREAYLNIFGFSLGELERFDSLSEEGVKNALFAASFGIDLKSPGEAAKFFNTQKQKLLRTNSKTGEINSILTTLGQQRTQIFEQRRLNHSYSDLLDQIKIVQKNIEDNTAALTLLINGRNNLKTRLSIWNDVEEWKKNNLQLQYLPEIPDTFPITAVNRLTDYNNRKLEKEAELAEEKNNLQQLEHELEKNQPEQIWLNCAAEINELLEHKTSYKQALRDIDTLKQHAGHLEKSLTANLEELGLNWTVERIAGMDRSLFKQDEMEKLALTLGKADLNQQYARKNLEDASARYNNAIDEKTRLEKLLADLPEYNPVLTQDERAQLLQDFAQLKECQNQYEPRKKSFESAKNNFYRAFSKLNITASVQQEPQIEEDRQLTQMDEILSALYAKEKSAKTLADECIKIQGEVEALENEIAEEEKREGECQSDLLHYKKENILPDTMDLLDERMTALHQLRNLNTQLEIDNRHIADLDERINLAQMGVSDKNWPFIVLGSISLIICAIFSVFFWVYHQTEIVFNPDLIIPINTSEIYVSFGIGICLLLAGWPRDLKKRKLELNQLKTKRESAALRLSDLAQKIQSNCQIAQIESADAHIVETLEKKLQNEKFSLLNRQRDQQEIQKLDRKLLDIKNILNKSKHALQEKTSLLQKKLHEWHRFMEELGVKNVPIPAGAETFFMQIENAKQTYHAVNNTRQELNNLGDSLYKLENSISSLPAIKNILAEAGGELSLQTAVNRTLASCAKMNDILEKRTSLEGEIKNIGKLQEIAEKEHNDALIKLEKSMEQTAEINAQWKKELDKFGLNEDLTPETMRKAFTLMEKCMTLEEEARLDNLNIKQKKQEIDNLEIPLRNLFEKIKKETKINLPSLEQEPINWLGILEFLFQQVKREEEKNNISFNLQTLIARSRTLISSKEAGIKKFGEEIANILRQGNADNMDQFLANSQIAEKRAAIKAEQARLSNIILNASEGKDLEKFINEFNKQDQETAENNLSETEEKIKQARELNDELYARLGNLQGEIKNLQGNYNLAALIQNETIYKEKLSKEIQDWLALTMGENLLKEAKKIYEQEKQPELMKIASGIFRKITNNKWTGLGVSMEDSQPMILSSSNEPIAPEVLSRGAQEQAYLALRLAYIESHAKQAEPLPVIMDEILVNFDPARAERTAKAIISLGNIPNQQLFYFTCHPDMVTLLKAASPHSPVYSVADKKITKNTDY